MSPENRSSIWDRRSENADERPLDDLAPLLRRGRPPTSRAPVLDAADRLLAAAEQPGRVSMDEIAAVAGVGKGTLFRAFGSRTGLIEALAESRSGSLRERIESGPPPLGPGGPPAARILAILDAVLDFKLENRHVMVAQELGGTELLEYGFYRWMHDLFTTLIGEAVPEEGADFAGYAAHALLGMQRVEVTDELRRGQGLSADRLRVAQRALARRLLGTG